MKIGLILIEETQSVSMLEPDEPKRDWHPKKLGSDEPSCPKTSWRTINRYRVVRIRDMSDSHLGHATGYAARLRQHASRLAPLLAEGGRRNRNPQGD